MLIAITLLMFASPIVFGCVLAHHIDKGIERDIKNTVEYVDRWRASRRLYLPKNLEE